MLIMRSHVRRAGRCFVRACTWMLAGAALFLAWLDQPPPDALHRLTFVGLAILVCAGMAAVNFAATVIEMGKAGWRVRPW